MMGRPVSASMTKVLTWNASLKAPPRFMMVTA